MAIGWGENAIAKRMALGWRGGLKDGTPCGGGSTMIATRGIRALLPRLVDKYGFKTVCDAGAGDMHWMSQVDWDADYQPFDLHPRRKEVTKLDISKELLPTCDLILCRHVLIHLDPERIHNAISLFRQSGKYLLASQYDDAGPFDSSEQFNKVNMVPLLGEPLERHPDAKAHIALWRLS